MDLDFGGLEPDECDGVDPEMTIGELMDWRYFKAERVKELVSPVPPFAENNLSGAFQGNKAFRKGDYEVAIKQYASAHDIEPELPHYQLNIAAAHLKLSKSVSHPYSTGCKSWCYP